MSLRWHRRCSIGLLLCTLALGCSGKTLTTVEGEPTGPEWFADITDACGLDFVHEAGPTGNYFMPQCIGSGCALFDANGDGRLDLYLLQNGGPKATAVNRFYLQQENGTFRDATHDSGLGLTGHNMGVAIGDVNNDGRPDVLVTQYGGIRLLLNQGEGKFTDSTTAAGLKNPQWGTSAAFFDANRDGWLDLIVVNYVEYDPTWPCGGPSGLPDFCAPKVFSGTASKLFLNEGAALGPSTTPQARFRDVTVAARLGDFPAPGLGVVCADFDGNGWPDLFIANDGKPNHLWMNRAGSTFTEEAVPRGAACTYMGQSYAGMGIALGDIDNDGLFDLYVTHLTSESNTLWRQEPRGVFRDQTTGWGLTGSRWRGTGWGTLLVDFDHDGHLDLALVNGRVQRGGTATKTGLPPFWEPYAERNQLFVNTGAGRFTDISPGNSAFCGTPNVGRGLACGDIDNDGALDLLVTAVAGRARLYRNVAPKRGHWLKVSAIDPKLQREAYGAEVTVHAGAQRWLRLLTPTHSFASSSAAEMHFGLGTVTQIERIEVLWPDGARETFPGGTVDRRVAVRKGTGSTPDKRP